MIGVIFSNGGITDYEFTKKYISELGSCFFIACDGGIRHLHNMGIKPDCLLGDFDSADKNLLAQYKKSGIEIKQFPVKKDMTDTELGIETAIEKGADEIIIFGGIGSRMDHSLANIHLLTKGLEKNIPIRLVNENNEIYAINKELVIENKAGQTLSLIPLTTCAEGVTAEGFEYPLKDFTLKIGTSLGVSNVVISKKAVINLKKGILLVMLARD